MKALILAAGYATRLYPLTLNQPKPLLKVGGKSIMERIIKKISILPEINGIFIVTNNKFFTNFNEWAEGFESRIPLKIINDNTTSNEDRLGAVGDIKFVIDAEKIDEDFLVFGGDNLFNEDLGDIYRFYKGKDRSVVAFKDVGDIEIAKRMGIASVDETQKITEFVEKPSEPKSTFAATCVYFIRKEDLPLIEDCLNENKSSEEVKAGELIAYMIGRTDVYGYVLKEMWFDIGDIDQLKEADEYWKGK
jgi:glucose-1-phosphate thymidylyltransferase